MKAGPIFRPKRKEKGYRAMIARWLVNTARKIYPDSEEVKAFYLQMINDYMIWGGAVTRVNPTELAHGVIVSNYENPELLDK